MLASYIYGKTYNNLTGRLQDISHFIESLTVLVSMPVLVDKIQEQTQIKKNQRRPADDLSDNRQNLVKHGVNIFIIPLISKSSSSYALQIADYYSPNL